MEEHTGRFNNWMEINIFILKYCIEKTFENRKPLISIDFIKTFDSIKRDSLIKILMEYKINSQVMEPIAKLYDGDITKMQLEEDEELSIPVSSGIRQGCTVSTALLKLVTYKIMKKLEELNKGLEDEVFKITSLFSADDGMLLTDSIRNAKKVVDTVTKMSRVWFKHKQREE